MKKVFLLTFDLMICVIFIISCKYKDNKNHCQKRSDIYSLIRNKDISFELDSLTPPKVNYVKLLTINDTLFFTLLNPYVNSIYCYEYNSKKLYKIIHLESDKKITGYEIINWNKILTYQYWTYNLTLQNGRGKILNNIIVPSKKDSYYALPNSHAQIIYKNKSVYLAGGKMSMKKPDETFTIVAQIDSSFSTINYKYHFPDIYRKIYFGGNHYRMDITYTYNLHRDFFVFNFPASHELFVTKDFVNESVYCAGSKYIESIPEYPYKGRSNNFRFCAENGFYFCILYNQYDSCYYRICLLPMEYYENKPYDRDLSIIILDKDFNIVGEKRLKSNSDFNLHYISSICVSPDGLLFQQVNDPGDESSIIFSSYKLKK